jgi:hypothetical protein
MAACLREPVPIAAGDLSTFDRLALVPEEEIRLQSRKSARAVTTRSRWSSP